MASSFVAQVPVVINIIKHLGYKRILDVGKGFGKYGFLIHEYCGIDNSERLKTDVKLKQQSKVKIDCVEIDDDMFFPHLNHFYSNIYKSDINYIYKDLIEYDLILMTDVIEHLDKDNALQILKFYKENKLDVLITTPTDFFEQYLYKSKYENHVSHWTLEDFKKIGFNVNYQKVQAGGIYLLSISQLSIPGFGNSFNKKIRRILRLIISEFS
jgi:hypothetical protein